MAMKTTISSMTGCHSLEDNAYPDAKLLVISMDSCTRKDTWLVQVAANSHIQTPLGALTWHRLSAQVIKICGPLATKRFTQI